MAAINIDVGANTRRAEKDIQKLVSKSYNINLKTRGDQPLGRITGKVNEFTKSLDASNARVIAFGASAGIIFGVQRAFEALARSVIDVEKSLSDINVILNVSTSQLQKFGGELFNIAKNTGQSFNAVAQAATEFSRQGLGLEETLKRTNNALILSRLSGLDAAKSVDALTAAVNSFASQAVTTTEIVNKFANVDAAFAVSSKDLAEAISRVGSSAAQSGVSLNELIAIVTSAQQTTARGGAVIGNSFKTIFTRLQRTEVIDLLDKLGVNTTDASGQIKSTINLLTDLAKVYDQLGTLQQAEVAEKVGGVFQINILKSALADLSKEYSVYNNALNVAASSTDQAIRRNEELNKTYAAQINALQENARQLAANVGDRLFGPSFQRVVGGANNILGEVNESDGQGIGATLAKGILDGLGQVLAGPGLALIGGIFIKLFKDLTKFASGSLKDLLGLNNASKQQADIQQSISQILAKNPKLIEMALQGEKGLAQAANQLLVNLQKQTIELQKQAQVASQIAKSFYSAGVRVQGGIPVAPTPGKPGKAAGYIPSGISPQDQISEMIGAVQGGYKPGKVVQVGGLIANTAEDFYKYPGVGQPEIRPPKNSEAGKNHRKELKKRFGFVPGEGNAKGYIPNFAQTKPKPKPTEVDVKGTENYGYLIPSMAPGELSGKDKFISPGTITDTDKNIKYIFPGQKAFAPKLKEESAESNQLENNIYKTILGETLAFTNRLLSPPARDVSEGELRTAFESTAKGAKGAILGAIGAAFEVGITTGLDYKAANKTDSQADFDVRDGAGIAKVQELFNIGGITKADFKATTGDDSVKSFRKKILKEKRSSRKGVPRGKKNAAEGFIPMLEDAVKNESAANVPKNQMYLAQYDALRKANEGGWGLFNKPQEPNEESRQMAMGLKGFAAKGYIPNFALTDDVTPANITSSVGALITELSLTALLFQGFRGDVSTAQEQIVQNLTEENAKRKEQLSTMQEGTAEHKKLSKSVKDTDRYIKGVGPKFEAIAQTAASSMILVAPVIAATLKNAIGRETKAARAVGTGVEGVGNTLAAASFAATIFGTGKGKKLGNIVTVLTALAAGAVTVNGVFSELGTDLPELSRAADEAAQKLQQFTDATSTIQSTFEQIKQLRESGQVERAGQVQQDLIANTLPKIESTSTQAAILTALRQGDQKGLQDAIAQATAELQKTNEKLSTRETIEQGVADIRNIGNGNMFTNFFRSDEDIRAGEKRAQEKRVAIGQNIFGKQLLNIAPKDASATDLKGFYEGLREKNAASIEGFVQILEQMGFEQAEVQKLLANEAEIRPILNELLNKQIAVQNEVINQTGQGNLVINAINKALEQVRANYDKYANAVSRSANLIIANTYGIQQALNRVKTNILKNQADISESFGGPESLDFRTKSIEAGVSEIDTEFTNNVIGSIQQVIESLKPVVEAGERRKFAEGTNTTGQSQAGAEAILGNTDILAGAIGEALKTENLQNLIKLPTGTDGQVDLQSFEGFDIDAILEELAKQYPQGEEDQKLLDNVAQKLDEANRTLLEQKRIQIEQKAIFAQQKFSEIAKSFINAVKSSFGGFEGFLQDNTERLDKFQTEAAGLRSLGGPGASKESQIEFSRGLGLVITELNKIAGRNIGPQLAGGADGALAQTIQQGLALSIKEDLDTIFGDLQNFQGSQEIADAFRKTLSQQLGATNGESLSNEEIAKRTAVAQTNAALAVGEVDQRILDSAKESLKNTPGGEDLVKLLDTPGVAAQLDKETINKLQLDTANRYLEQIAENTKKGEKEVNDVKPEQERRTQEESRRNDAEGTGQSGSRGRDRAKAKKQQIIYEEGVFITPDGSTFTNLQEARDYVEKQMTGSASGRFPMVANSKEFLAKNVAAGGYSPLGGILDGLYKKEINDQRKYGYSGGKPLLLDSLDFNPNRDAIITPPQKEILNSAGFFPDLKRLNSAGGSAPQNFWNSIDDELKDTTKTGSAPTDLEKTGKLKKIWDKIGGFKGVGRKLAKGGLQSGLAIFDFFGDVNERRTKRGQSKSEAVVRSLLERSFQVGGAIAGGRLGFRAGALAGTVGGLYTGPGAVVTGGIGAGVGGVAGQLGGGAIGYGIGNYLGNAVYGPEKDTRDDWKNISKETKREEKFTGDQRKTIERLKKERKEKEAMAKKLENAGTFASGIVPKKDPFQEKLDQDFASFQAIGKKDAFQEKLDQDYANFKALPGPTTSPVPVSDNGIIKRYKTPEEAQLASKLAQEANFNKMSPEQQDFYKQSNFQDELAKKIGGIVTGGSQAEVDAYLKEKANSVGMGDRFITDYLEPEARKKQRAEQRQKLMDAQKVKKEELQKNLDWIYRDNPKGKEDFLKRFGYNKTPRQNRTPSTTPYRLLGGKDGQTATQLNTITGTADYVPKATTPDSIIKRETTPSQDDLRKLMPPQYFQRVAKNYLDQLNETYNSAINSSRDPRKAMAYRKRLDYINALYNQGIDSRSTNMAKFNELEQIYKSHKQQPMPFDEYKKTTEYRNRLRNSFAGGYIPPEAQQSIMREEKAGIPKSKMGFQQYPELQNINNVRGLGLFSRDEVGKERMAMAARGYIPNFANALKTESKGSNVSFNGININVNSSTQGVDYSSIGPQVQALLEDQIPKMMSELERQQAAITKFNATAATVDNMSRQNGGKNLPPPSVTKQKTLKT